MEHHGENPQQLVFAIIPARLSSTRLPGKMLADIHGKPLIAHTVARVLKSRLVTQVYVATDDLQIVEAVCACGASGVMTSPDHASGSDRIAEVAATLPENSIIVNVQGDEPMISPETIDRVVQALLDDEDADMATAYEPINDLRSELLNFNVVKVVVGDAGYALYFTRSPAPFPREAVLRHGGEPNPAMEAEPEILSVFKKHTGIYAYRREYLLRFTSLPQTALERLESLEQIRALEDGASIRVVEAAASSIGVDTQEDLDRVREMLAK